jgi:Skp family chaperone for outer membrane proteins
MKKITQIIVLTVAVAGLGAATLAADQKVATFNLRKAFDKYYKTVQSTSSLKQEAADAQKEHDQRVESGKKLEDEWRVLIDKANDQSLSAEERDKSKKAAEEKYVEIENQKQARDEFDRSVGARLREKERQRRDAIVEEIQGVVNAHAKAGGYSMVIDSSGDSANMTPVLLYSDGKDDMTDVIIKELNAAAPPGSLDTNAPAASATNNPSPAK